MQIITFYDAPRRDLLAVLPFEDTRAIVEHNSSRGLISYPTVDEALSNRKTGERAFEFLNGRLIPIP